MFMWLLLLQRVLIGEALHLLSPASCAFSYSHGVILAGILVLRLCAFDSSFAQALVSAYMCIGESPVFLYNYGNCQ